MKSKKLFIICSLLCFFFVSALDSYAEKRIPSTGLYIFNDKVGQVTLSSVPGLIDGNTATSAGINIGKNYTYTTYHQVGIDLFQEKNVKQLYIYTTQTDQYFSDGFNFWIYTSFDNTTWELDNSYAKTYDKNNKRFDIFFPTLKARYIKVVTSDVYSKDLYVTEIEAYGEDHIDYGFSPKVWKFDLDPTVPIQEQINQLEISKDGNYAVLSTIYKNSSIYLFHKDSNRYLWKFATNLSFSIKSIGISDDGSRIVASVVDAQNIPKIYLFDNQSNIPLQTFFPEYPCHVAISGDGNYIVASEMGGVVSELRKSYLYHHSDPQPLWSVTHGIGTVRPVISRYGDFLAISALSETGTYPNYPQVIRFFSKTSSVPLWSHEFSGGARSLSLSDDGTILAAGTVGVFDTASGIPSQYLNGYGLVSGNGANIVAPLSDPNHEGIGLVLFATESEALLWMHETEVTPSSVSISNDGNLIAAVENKKVGLFRKDTSDPVWTCDLENYNLVKISGSGRYIYAAGSTSLTLFDTAKPVPSEVWVNDDYCPSCQNDSHIWGYDAFANIQDAVYSLWDGGSVYVAPGTYYEPTEYKSGYPAALYIPRGDIKIFGAGYKTTIIDSDRDSHRVIIKGNDCEVSGFTIQHSGGPVYIGPYSYYSGVLIYGADAVVSRNSIIDNGFGVYVSADNASIVNNVVTKNDYGLVIRGPGAEIINNTIVSNGVGVSLENGTSSPLPLILNSIIWGNHDEYGTGDDNIHPYGDFIINYSNVEQYYPGEGNISLAPLFAAAGSGDYRLQPSSPGIGLGSPYIAPGEDIDNNPRPSPLGKNPDMGAYENALAWPVETSLDFFAMEVGNFWSYQGNGSLERKVASTDEATFPVTTYKVEIRENGTYVGEEYYEKTTGQLKLWGMKEVDGSTTYTTKFQQGLPVVWFPLSVGYHAYNATTCAVSELPGYTFNVSISADVLSKVSLSLGFGTLDAFQIQYQLRLWGNGVDGTSTFTWWVIPYIGVGKDLGADYSWLLSDFSINGGRITSQSDIDGDGLRDYDELLTHNSSYGSYDTDHDGLSDFEEVQRGTLPRTPDTDGDGVIDGYDSAPLDASIGSIALGGAESRLSQAFYVAALGSGGVQKKSSVRSFDFDGSMSFVMNGQESDSSLSGDVFVQDLGYYNLQDEGVGNFFIPGSLTLDFMMNHNDEVFAYSSLQNPAWQEFGVGVKNDGTDFMNSSVIGAYYFNSLTHRVNGTKCQIGKITFNGSGRYTASATISESNSAANVQGSFTGTYEVNNDGTVSLYFPNEGSPVLASLSTAGNIIIGAMVSEVNAQGVWIGIKKEEANLNNKILYGTYGMVEYTLNAGAIHSSMSRLVFDGFGGFSIEKTYNDSLSGANQTYSGSGTYSVNGDGTVTLELDGVSANASLGEEGKLFVVARVDDVNVQSVGFGFKVADDKDADGIDASFEKNAPNNGDANNDGTPDSDQDNVASLLSAAGDSYITVDTITAGDGSVLAGVAALDKSTLPADPLYNLPFGLVGFTVLNPGNPGFSEIVRIYFHGVADLTGSVYRKFDPNTSTWYTLPDVVFGAALIGGQTVAFADLPLTDGGNGDSDLLANGTIVDPGGPALPICTLTGDFDADNDVDINDYNTFKQNWGWSGAAGSGHAADFDNDGDVDINDYNTFKQNWGRSCQ